MISMRNAVRFVLGGGFAALATGHVACSTTPPEEHIPTFQRAERLATLCLKVNRDLGNGGFEPLAEAEPAPPDRCNGANPELEFTYQGEGYPYHLFALATGTLTGELEVGDMTIFQAADTDRSTPGVNFIPVGENPTDVSTTPDSRWAFVASAASQKPALYAIPSNFIVGDGRDGGAVPKLTDLISCSLPQAPAGLAIVPNGSSAKSPYDVVVVLPGDRLTPARIAVIDVAAFRDPRVDADASDAGAQPDSALRAGSFEACPLKSLTDATLPPPPPPGPDLPWNDGVAYLVNGARTADDYPLPASCGARTGSGGGGAPADAGSGGTSDAPDAGGAGAGGAATLLPARAPRFGRSTQDGSILYVADLDNPIIHVFDLSVAPPVELPALEVISSADPTGTVSVREIAVSPPTRTFKRFLYAVEAAEGSILVYDVSDKASTYRKPLVRPHAELQPFQPVDRIAFASPVNALTFARHDVAVAVGATYASGVLCNPNPRIDNGDLGALYTENSTRIEPVLGPRRLRGVFGFAALANGQIVILDVDDWDAPCRRPANLSEPPDAPRASSISEPQVLKDGDPYGAPLLLAADAARVSREAFFPVSAPHRLRSQYMLRNENDTEGGDRVPTLPGSITLSQGNTPLDTTGNAAQTNPLLQPTFPTFADPSGIITPQTGVDGGALFAPGVRLSYEVPDVHLDQDWAVSYEGALPGFDKTRGALSSTSGHQTLTLRTAEINFCLLGIEDTSLARQHVASFNDALRNEALVGEPDPLLERRVGDYVQITDEILPELDPYWLLAENDCWGEIDATLAADLSPPQRGSARRDVCVRTFGNAADALTSRDFPILEAREGELVLGRYQYPQDNTGSVRERTVVGADTSNRGLLSAAQCCFHNQVQYNVRAGGTWLAFGSVNGYLHHVEAEEGGRCVQSCESRERLMNSRIFGLPREVLDRGFAPTRSSVLAMRNPMFSYFMVEGRDANGRVRPERDVVWRFQTRNQFAALALSLTDTQSSANPKAMQYLAPLGQVVLLDGASQGLTLIDLRTFGFASTPVF